jgi:hypothetical protein
VAVERWAISVEYLGGDTENSTQESMTLQWTSATVTLRRRAPHTFEVRLPRNDLPYQRAIDFRAGRQLWITRNGAYWFAGFMNSATLSGYDRAARAFQQIVLPGWGNAYALMLDRNVIQPAFTSVTYAGFDVDGIISDILNNVNHGSGGDWFTAGGRTIYASATTLTSVRLSSKSALEHINDLCDIDGTAWRAGVNAAGAFTFAVGTTVEQDHTTTIRLFDNANCQIVDLQRDGTLITSGVMVVSKRPAFDTRIATAVIAGANTLNLDTVAGIVAGTSSDAGDQILIGVGLATQETRLVTSISGTTVTVLTPFSNAHSLDEVVKIATPGSLRVITRTAAASVAQGYHARYWVIYNDQITDQTQRQEVGDQYLAAYDHPLTTATVEIVDATLISMILDAGVQPGDYVNLTSGDAELIHFYNLTTVKVQEMSLELEPGRVKQITLTVGDPRQDEFTRFERRLQAAHTSATSSVG